MMSLSETVTLSITHKPMLYVDWFEVLVLIKNQTANKLQHVTSPEQIDSPQKYDLVLMG